MILDLRKLHRAFDGIEAIKHFDLELQQGKITALIGPNGAGKTTLFNLVTGFVPLSGGEIVWMGQDISGTPPYGVARMGISRTFQEVRLFRSLTVMENLLMARRKEKHEGIISAILSRGAFKKQDLENRSVIEGWLEALALSDKADVPASALSYGQSKMLEILRAIVTHPKLLLLDEPVAGLNPRMIEIIRSFLTKVVRENGLTLFLIEHNMPFVSEIADRVVVLNHGTKIAEGTPESVRLDPRVLKAYLG